VCFFVLCNRHWFNKAPGPDQGDRGSCYETASVGCSMYSDLPVPGSTGRSRLKVRTPRGQIHPLKASWFPGGPSMQCCPYLRPTTSGRRTHRSAVVRSVRGRAAAQVAQDTGTSAQAHTPGTREHLPSRELPPPPVSRLTPEWLLRKSANCSNRPGSKHTF